MKNLIHQQSGATHPGDDLLVTLRRVGLAQERSHHQGERLRLEDEDQSGRVAPRRGDAALPRLRRRPHPGDPDVGPEAGLVAHQDPRGTSGELFTRYILQLSSNLFISNILYKSNKLSSVNM